MPDRPSSDSSDHQTPGLAYIALASRDVERTSAFLGSHLALTAFPVTTPGGESAAAFRVGATALVVLPVGHPFLTASTPGVDHIAVAAPDPASALAATGLPPHPVAPEGLGGSHQTAVAPSAACHVAIRFSPALAMPVANNHPVTRIDHIGIASAGNAKAEALFCGPLSARYESRQTDMEIATAMESFTSDKYGAVYHARRPEPVGGLRVSFLTVGDLELEFLENFNPDQGFEIRHGTAGTTKQDQSAIGRFVAARGGGLHHIAFKVDDIDALLGEMANLGHRMIDQIGRPGSRRARIGFIHPSSTGGILFHFVEREELVD